MTGPVDAHDIGLSSEGEVIFVSSRHNCLAATTTGEGLFAWRSQMADGGVVIDVRDNREICSGLSMPHSPRFHGGHLWVLNSGAGELGTVDRSGAKGFDPIATLPGLARGLAFHQHVAVVGLSRPRYGTFTGFPLEQRLVGQVPWCGLQFIDTRSGALVHWLRLEGSVAEIYDVAVLPG